VERTEPDPPAGAEAEPAPWALQLAVRVERTDPPTVEAVCRGAARATLALLADQRSRPGGPWHPAIVSWRTERIRKLVRRGRASAWDRAQDVPGVTVTDGAEVRAFVPTPMDAIDEAVAKLQIDGRSAPLEGPTRTDTIEARAGTLVVALTPAVDMTWGKLAAQAAHGAQLAWEAAGETVLAAWAERGHPVVVVFPTPAAWDRDIPAGAARVRDGGFTEIPPGTLTAAGWFVAAR
jgi:peptidyl-tRNA hydrolase